MPADQNEQGIETEAKVQTRGSRAQSIAAFRPAAPNTVRQPWETRPLQGVALLRSPLYNKGQAFSRTERYQLRLTGLLPHQTLSLKLQVQRAKENIAFATTNLDKYIFLMNLQRSNEKLYYAMILDDPNAMLPLVYTPTVGLACQRFGHLANVRLGLYISLGDRHRVRQVLDNWPQQSVRAIVFTDGERILGLGDLGINGMGIPIGKMALYTALGGVDPSQCLPVTLDVGTNNEELLNDPLYTGLRRTRERGEAYDALINEFVNAVRQKFGPYTLLQFEDFANKNAFRLLNKYKDTMCTFNDDIQGTAGVTVAAFLSYARAVNKPLSDMKYCFFGAGSAAIGISDLLSYAISMESKCSIEEARKQIFLVDSRGLVTKDRPSGGITEENQKVRYAHDVPHMGVGLAAIVKALKVNCLVGVSAIANMFTQEVIENMAANDEKPLICSLSNPTSKSECTAEQAYKYTDGKVFFCSGSPFKPYEHKGKVYHTGQANNSYIFPGVALGVLTVVCRRVPESFFYIAAKTLAEFANAEDIKTGNLFPNLTKIRAVSLKIATAIAEEAYKLDLATLYPKPENLEQFISDGMYKAEYEQYVHDDYSVEDI